VAAGSVDEPVTDEEGARAGQQAEHHGGSPGVLVCLLSQFERHSADEDSGAERHDKPDQPAGDW